MDSVEVGLALAAPGNRNQSGPLQFPHEFSHARPAHAHVLGQTILTRKARIVVPRVAQEHRIRHLRTQRQVGVFEDEIGHLRKTAPDDWIVRGQLQVMLPDHFPNLLHA